MSFLVAILALMVALFFNVIEVGAGTCFQVPALQGRMQPHRQEHFLLTGF
jgi:hypothetical protein